MLYLKWVGICFMTWFLLSMILTVMGIKPVGTVNVVIFFFAVGIGIVGFRGDKAKRRERTAAATAKTEERETVTF